MNTLIRFMGFCCVAVGIAGCTVYSVPEAARYRSPAVWRDASVSLHGLKTFIWLSGTTEGLQPGSVPVTPAVAQKLRTAIVQNLKSCYQLRTSGRVDFWVAFDIIPAGKTPLLVMPDHKTGLPHLEVFVGRVGQDKPVWASAVAVPAGFPEHGQRVDDIVHDLFIEFPNGNPRSCG